MLAIQTYIKHIYLYISKRFFSPVICFLILNTVVSYTTHSNED